MSLSSALTVALSGLQASTTGAQIASGNISNAQTPGYTEKSAALTEVTNGTSLGGVTVSGYNRVSDSVLSATLNNATSNASYLSAQNNYMTQVQSMLDSSDNPPALASAMAGFQSAWTQFSAAPEDVTQQEAVISAGQQLANTVNSIATQVTALQTQVQDNLSTTVTSLNTDLAQVQNLNTQIAATSADNQPIGDLQDQRDQVVNAIAAITNVQVMQRANGAIALYTPGGTALLDGQAQVFSVSGDTVTNAVGANVNSELTGGSLQAQTDFLSSSTSTAPGVGVIGKLQSQLQNFANMFVSTASGGFANTYDSATTASGEQGSQFFTATIDPNTGLPDLGSFAVNSNLVNGTTTVKQAAAEAVAPLFSATNMAITTSGTSPSFTYATGSTFNSTGLTINNQTYTGVATAILSGFQQAANTINASNTTAQTQQTYYQNALSSETGVNTDTELVNLTNWQNAYAASAHVISTIESMFSILENLAT